MSDDENPLAQPVVIKGVHIKNRLVKSATQESMTDGQGGITNAYKEYYERLSRGGVGLIITGHMYVKENGKLPGMVGIEKDERISPLRQVIKYVHQNNSVIFAQVNYANLKKIIEKKSGKKEWLPNTLSKESIEEIIDCFGKAAARIKKAGFDGIQLHAAHSYLLAQFLSKKVNQRQDKYGGSLSNRQRLCLEVYQAIRESVGEEFPVIVKLDSYSRSFVTVPPLVKTITLQESLYTAKKLEERGVDAIEVTCFLATRGALPYKQKHIDWLKTQGKETRANIVGVLLTPIDLVINHPQWFKPHQNIAHIKAFKQHLHIPILAGSCFRDPIYMKKVITNNEADMICLARPLIYDPDFPNAILNGDESHSKCRNCNLCSLCLPPNERPLYCVYTQRHK